MTDRVTGRHRHTAALLAAGAALLPLQIWPPMPVGAMQLSDAFFALAFARFLWPRPEVPPAIAATAILAFAAGADLSAFYGGLSIKLIGHFELCALAWMAACLPEAGARRVRQALVAAAALAAVTAVAGIAVYFAGYAHYDSTGIPDHPLLYIHGALVPDSYPRPRGTLVTGAMLAATVATGMALLWFERDLLPASWARGLVYALGVIALFFAFSRGIATLALVLAAFYLWRRGGAARALCAIMTLIYAAVLWTSLRYAIVLNPTEPWAIEVLADDGERFTKWRQAAAVLAQHPLTGAGPGTAVAGGYSAHNTWLNLWAVLGVVPLVAFAVLMATALNTAARARALGLAAALTFALIESSYNDIEDMRHVWLILGLAIAAARSPHDGNRDPTD